MSSQKRTPGVLEKHADAKGPLETWFSIVEKGSWINFGEVLRILIDDRKTNQRAAALGSGVSISTIFEILGGGRALNLDHVAKLATHFKVDPGVFIPEQMGTTSKGKRRDKQGSK